MKISFANLQHGYARLAPRERMFAGVGGGVLLVVLAFLAIRGIESAKSSLRTGISAKQRQLERVQALRGDYLALRRQADELTAKSGDRSPSGLYSTIEGLLKKSLGREKIHSMDPSSKPVGDHYVEDSVNVELVGVSLPQTVALLYDIEQSATPIHISRLQLKKRVADPYQFDVVLSVASVKMATS